MSAGRHASGDTSFARSAGGAATRGIVLIVVAVIIGVVLIATAVDDAPEVVTAAPDTTAASAPATTAAATPGDTTAPTTAAPGQTTAPTTAAPAETTPTTAATTPTSESDTVFQARPASVVSVQVVNTTRVGGAAGRMTDTLKAQGYVTLSAATDTGGILADTKIHHIGGYLLEAQALATLLGLDPAETVFSMPTNPGATIDNYLDPQVLVLLGSDLAG